MRNLAPENEPTTEGLDRNRERLTCGDQDRARPPFVDAEPGTVRRLLAAAADGSALVIKVHAEARPRGVGCGAES